MKKQSEQNTQTGSKSKKSRRSSRSKQQEELRFIPLGGVGEIGKNMYLLEYGEDIMIIDSGLMFPDEDMLGIDYVIPDITYLEKNKHRIRGLVLTHGHEDHIGALPFVLPKIDCPIYGTKLTLGLVRSKFEEAIPRYKAEMHEISANDTIQLGVFGIRFISVCHSIPDGVGLAIDTPLGKVVHTGDFKLDPTPIDGRITDYSTFAELGNEGVMLMLSDSTNVERSGFTPSERVVGRTLERIFRLHRSRRIIMASFASNLHRVQQVFDTAAQFNRKVALMGRSMIRNVELARELGYLNVDDSMFLPMHEANNHPPNRTAVLTTGSQGEPFSGLVLMSKGEHRHLNVGSKDLVVVNATPIPGNEKLVSRTINRLFACGCEVIYEENKEIHVSGHAAREELKMMLSMVRPDFFVPIHGEYRHQVRHAQLAEEVGVSAKHAFVMRAGDVLRITGKRAGVKQTVPAGAILVDGKALGEMEDSLLKERRDLSEDGVIVVSIAVDRQLRLKSTPRFESRGYVHKGDARELYEMLEESVTREVGRVAERKDRSPELLAEEVRGRLRSLLRKNARSNPLVMPMISVVKE
ncbi:MAG: ribonuclease J [Synergistales bacterium]|nr:ribonuclease J [Synergistales bacterium]